MRTLRDHILVLLVLATGAGAMTVADAQPGGKKENPIEVPNLKRDGAFVFPQAQAQILCDTKTLRLSAWNDATYLYLQAILWTDNDDALGKGDPSGQRSSDTGHILVDIDANGALTPKIDHYYRVLTDPKTSTPMAALIVTANGGYRGNPPAKLHGGVRYVTSDGNRIRVDSFVISIAQLGRKPGENVRLVYWGDSPSPNLTVNSVGFKAQPGSTWKALPWNQFHTLKLADRPPSLDLKKIPTGR